MSNPISEVPTTGYEKLNADAARLQPNSASPANMSRSSLRDGRARMIEGPCLGRWRSLSRRSVRFDTESQCIAQHVIHSRDLLSQAEKTSEERRVGKGGVSRCRCR